MIERALTAWSDLPNADIRWEVAGEARSDYGNYGPRDRSANWVSINPNGAYGGAARSWWRRSGSVWRRFGCTIVGGSWLAREPPDRWKELDEDDPDRLYPGLDMWIHEFGHCLGLLHSQRLPTNWLAVRGEYDEERERHRWHGVFQSDPWIADPQMSYGWSDFGLEHPVTADDAVGAALLRPARGWLRSVGAIAGSLQREGRPVRYAHVWAFPVDAMPKGGRPGPVGAFSNREGDFLIEGLAPGRYVLWASPMTERPAHHTSLRARRPERPRRDGTALSGAGQGRLGDGGHLDSGTEGARVPRAGALRPTVNRADPVPAILRAGGFAAALFLSAAGCGDGGGSGAPAAPGARAPAPTPTPSATVSFREATRQVREGAAAEVGIRYRTANLSAPITLQIAASGGSASEDDYVLSVESLEIPAGSGTSGELALSVQTVEDDSFAEGDETLVLGVQPAAGSTVQLDGSFELVIEEAGVRPCAGILVFGQPPVLVDDWDSLPGVETETATIRLILETDPASAAVVFDWVGPYKDYHRAAAWNPSFRVRNVDPVTQLDQNLVHWSFEPTAEGVRHTFEFEWLAHLEAGFRFRSEEGGCVGEPEAVCTGTGCELRP